MLKSLGRLSRFMHYVACVALLLVTFVTMSDITLRAFKRPIVGSLEIVTFLGALLIAFSLPYTTEKGGHVYVDILVDKLKGRAKAVLVMATRIFGVVLFIFIGANFINYGFSTLRSGEVSPSFRIPLYPLSFALAFAFFIEALILVSQFYRLARGEG